MREVEDRLYKIGEFAKMIGVSVKTLQNWDNDGTLVATKSPTGRRYYTKQDYLKVFSFANRNKG